MAKSILLVVAFLAMAAYGAQDNLATDMCGVRATAYCAKQGCAGRVTSTEPCHYECDSCVPAAKNLGFYAKLSFTDAACQGLPRNISAGGIGQCFGHDFVSCSSEMCVSRSFAQARCVGPTHSATVKIGECTPDGKGGSEKWQAIASTNSMIDAGLSACPYKDVEKLLCAEAIIECVATCFGGIESCLECIASKVGSGDLKICCQTLSYYVGFSCSDCNDLGKK